MRNVYMVDGPQMPQMIVLIGMSQQYWQIGYWIPFQSLIEFFVRHFGTDCQNVWKCPSNACIVWFCWADQTTRLNMTSSFLTFLYEVSEVVYPPGIERTEGGAWNYSHEDAIDWDHLQEDLKHYTGDLEIEKHREIEEMDRALEVTSINREEGMLKIGKLKSENDRTEMECMLQFWESALQPEVNMQPKGASKSCGSCDALSEACCEWIATRQSHLSYGGLVGEIPPVNHSDLPIYHEIDPGSPPRHFFSASSSIWTAQLGRPRAPNGNEWNSGWTMKTSWNKGPLITIGQTPVLHRSVTNTTPSN